MANYASPLYWQERYAFDPSASFDWLLSYEDLRPHLSPLLRPDSEIFIPGAGNSTLGPSLYADGFRSISVGDISSVVISQLRDRHHALSEMDFAVLDACDMAEQLPEPNFDLIIDKALMDAVLCGEDAWRRTTAMVREMHRVLKPGGTYVVISYGTPSSRVGYLSGAGLDWAVKVFEIPKPPIYGFKAPPGTPSVYFMYTCTKPAEAAAAASSASLVAPKVEGTTRPEL